MGPGAGRWRTVRVSVLALACAGLPLLGHDVDPAVVGGLATVILVTAVSGPRLATRQAPLLRIVLTVLAGQVAVHVALGVRGTGHGADAVRAATHHDPGWLPGGDGILAGLATHVVLALAVAVVLHECEWSLWAWFRITLLRVARPFRSLYVTLTPDVRDLPPASRTRAVVLTRRPAASHPTRAPPLPA